MNIEHATNAYDLMDKGLLKVVHREQYLGRSIIAMMTRFGGLMVSAYEDEDTFTCLYHGNNVLQARRAVKQHIQSMQDEYKRLANI